MSLSSALSFVFRGHNIRKFVLYAVLYFSASMALGMLESSLPGQIGSYVFSCLLSGYYISILRSLCRGSEDAPDISLLDFVTGFKVGLSSLLYLVPVLALGIFLLLNKPTVLAVVILVAVSFLFAYAFQIGWLRQVIHDKPYSVYVLHNIRIMFANMGAVLRLLVFQLAIAGLGAAVIFLLLNLIGSLVYSTNIVLLLILLALFNITVFLVMIAMMVPLAQFGQVTGMIAAEVMVETEKPKNLDRAYVS